jgi:hypothetical protein
LLVSEPDCCLGSIIWTTQLLHLEEFKIPGKISRRKRNSLAKTMCPAKAHLRVNEIVMHANLMQNSDEQRSQFRMEPVC